MPKQPPNLLYEALLINFRTNSTVNKLWLRISRIRSANKTLRCEDSPNRWIRIPEKPGKLPKNHAGS